MKKLNDKQMKDLMTNILIYIDKICNDNQIKYSLYAGTAIGAIRHKGFIPWDDDIDIILDHENYTKLNKILKEINDSDYVLLEEDDSNYYPYMKLVNKNTKIIEKNYKEISSNGLFVDIFEYNNAPESRIKAKFHYFMINYYKNLISGLAWKKDKIRSFRQFVLFLRNIVSKIYGKKLLFKLFNKRIHKYNNKKCSHVISNWPIYGFIKEYQLKSNINEFTNCEFENNRVMIFKNYDEILKTTYGDYMQLPPKEKQVNKHEITAYLKKEEI